MHFASDRVQGGAWPKQGWRLHLPSLRRPPDPCEPEQADRHKVSSRKQTALTRTAQRNGGAGREPPGPVTATVRSPVVGERGSRSAVNPSRDVEQLSRSARRRRASAARERVSWLARRRAVTAPRRGEP